MQKNYKSFENASLYYNCHIIVAYSNLLYYILKTHFYYNHIFLRFLTSFFLCRHTCICASCFGKLDRCPMCRSPIKSYFCIRGEEYMPPEKEVNPCKHRRATHGPSHWLHDWNDRLTDFLGFAR